MSRVEEHWVEHSEKLIQANYYLLSYCSQFTWPNPFPLLYFTSAHPENNWDWHRGEKTGCTCLPSPISLTFGAPLRQMWSVSWGLSSPVEWTTNFPSPKLLPADYFCWPGMRAMRSRHTISLQMMFGSGCLATAHIVCERGKKNHFLHPGKPLRLHLHPAPIIKVDKSQRKLQRH